MPLAIDTLATLPVSEKEFGYNVVIQSSGGTGPHQWTLLSGTLPPGIVLDTLSVAASTTLVGLPTNFGTYVFTIRVEDSLGATATRTFTLEVIPARQLVSFNTRVIDPATNLGVQVQSISAEIYDVQHQLRQTLVFPVGIREESDAQGYLYSISNFDVSDDNLYRGDYLHVKWTATVGGNVLPSWWEMVGIGEVLVPDISVERNPYCSVPDALTYFKSIFDKRERWAAFNERPADQLLALVAASDNIDQEKFKGFKLRVFESNTHSRQWPRFMPLGERARGLLGDSEIPERVQFACAEQALWLLEQRQKGHDMEMRQFLQSSGLTGITRGTQQESWDLTRAQKSALCPSAMRWIQPFLATFVDDTPGVM